MVDNRIRLDGGFQNDVFYLEEKEKVVRVSNARKTKEMILQEIEWMNFLYEHGVAIPKPEMDLEKEEGRIRAYFEFIEGDLMDVTNVFHWKEEMFEQWGRTLGSMHALSKKYRAKEVYRPVWTVENPDVFDIRSNLSPWLKVNYDELMQSLNIYEITSDTFGLIHNDFHQGNLIVTEEGIITTIDFDDCAFNWFAQDIAVAFYHAYWQHSSYNDDTNTFPEIFMHYFFKGYRTENLLHEDTIKQIPIFLKLREIFLYQLFIRKWDRDNLEEWQQYILHGLEEKMKGKIPYAGISDFLKYTF